jgi:hypothetical protein
MRTSNRYATFVVALVVVALGATIFAARLAGQDNRWRITHADYGYGNRRTDVTDILGDLIARGGVNGRVAVNNQTMGGDPAVGADKTLRIIGRNDRNEEHEFDYREGGFVDASMFAVRRDARDERDRDDRRDDRDGYRERDRGDFSVIMGFYGVQGRTANVTDLLRSMVRRGGLTIRVNNGSLGGDPAPGGDKVLIVIYQFRGSEQAAAVREGNVLAIP